MLRVLGLSLFLLIGGIACGDDDDADPPDKCDAGPKGCGGSGGAGMDAAVDASPPDSGKPDAEIDAGDDDAGE